VGPKTGLEGCGRKKVLDPPAFKTEPSSPQRLSYPAHLGFTVDPGYCPVLVKSDIMPFPGDELHV